ncbi:hypothetical protein E2C01_000244 [Portunus trituberculatus]|uniref:Uncharacterized protein n=1 Tax=Portunus trituberculatus TaxID=210409 RepID=A0A5B7CDT2_PORTR|nr:hypothetical protein [Portunus trituberculatus]
MPPLLLRSHCTRPSSSHPYSVQLSDARNNQYSQLFIPFTGSSIDHSLKDLKTTKMTVKTVDVGKRDSTKSYSENTSKKLSEVKHNIKAKKERSNGPPTKASLLENCWYHKG